MVIQDDPKTRDQVPAVPALRLMITGFMVTQSIYVAAKLGIADLLKDGPKSCDELANAVRAHPDALCRMLRALASMGIFAENQNGHFELTPLAMPLQTGVPGSLRAWAVMMGEEWVWRPWGELLYSVRTGEIAFDRVFAMGLFDYLSRNPEAGETFNEGMTASPMQPASAVVAAYDFSRINTIVDVGGGHGAQIAAILKANPHTSGILFDLPHVIEGARSLLEVEGVAARCELVGGDFFQSVPISGGAYILKAVIHDWDDDRSIAILKNCYRAMTNSGKLLLVERVMPARIEQSAVFHLLARFDLHMMVFNAGGRDRTETEFRALLDAAGFKLTNIFPTQSMSSIIEGVPV